MLFIFVIFLLIIAFFLLGRPRPQIRWLRLVVFLLANLLIVEIFIYGYFLVLIANNKSFNLIGNQKFLDKLIALRLVDTVYVRKDDHNTFYQIDDDLGYTVGKSREYQRYKSSSQGLRANRNYSLLPKKNVLRMALFGDSFIFCDGERLENTWPFMLENSVQNLEVMNFGVSGYGLGQSYLRFMKEGVKFQPDIILFNYVLAGTRDLIDASSIASSGNLELTTIYRPHFLFDHDDLLSKTVSPLSLMDRAFRDTHIYWPLGYHEDRSIFRLPIFSWSNTGLLIKTLILKNRFAKHPMELSYSFAETLNVRILADLIETARKNNSTVLFFYGIPFDQLPLAIKALLMKYRENVIYFDSTAALEERFNYHGVKREDLLNVTNHFNAQGNLYYAEALAAILKSRSWGHAGRQFQFDPKTTGFNLISAP